MSWTSRPKEFDGPLMRKVRTGPKSVVKVSTCVEAAFEYTRSMSRQWTLSSSTWTTRIMSKLQIKCERPHNTFRCTCVPHICAVDVIGGPKTSKRYADPKSSLRDVIIPSQDARVYEEGSRQDRRRKPTKPTWPRLYRNNTCAKSWEGRVFFRFAQIWP